MKSVLDDIRSDAPVFFITGNSRSGTTMMMRIMDNHSRIHSINEPHFFEQLWSPSDDGKRIDRKEASDLLAKLFTGQRAGFFEPVAKHRHEYEDEIEQLLNLWEKEGYSRLGVYRGFLHYESQKAGKEYPCEKTPQNVFYLVEILKYFPGSKVINMIRDPRATMLSQKRKWKRRELGADFITRREVLRLKINYHPLTVSRLWKSAIGAVQRFENHPQLKNVRFEDLVANPNKIMAEVCEFLGVDFEPEMLLVPHAGSSSEADRKDKLGIKKPPVKSWTERGLSQSELRICQNICGNYMDKYGYDKVENRPSALAMIGQYSIFPVKIAMALIVNLNRMRSIGDTIKRRLFAR